ncbi:50S ribosomal protein L17 [Oligoflexaceae bacterium]|nr:50S ribosomal protein L17 [Oligoflexaceae bacterium]
MRHRHGYRKLGRTSDHRRAMLRNMTTSVILHEKMETTVEKAKEVKRLVEKMVTLGKRGDLHARRQASSYLFDKKATHKLFTDLAGRFKERPGGYMRIIRLGARFGDGANMASLQFVDHEVREKSEPTE